MSLTPPAPVIISWVRVRLRVKVLVRVRVPVYCSKDDGGGGGDNWSHKMCKAAVKSSPPTDQHIAFYRPDALPVAQPTLSKNCRKKASHSVDLLGLVHPCL